MRKCVVLMLGLLGAVLLGGYLVLWLTAPRHRVSHLGWEGIEVGMTQTEVEQVLGGPPGNYASTPYGIMRRQIVPQGATSLKEWRGEEGVIDVWFGLDGKVVDAYWVELGYPIHESLLTRLRRWLGITP
jgi:hypothetical protein